MASSSDLGPAIVSSFASAALIPLREWPKSPSTAHDIGEFIRHQGGLDFSTAQYGVDFSAPHVYVADESVYTSAPDFSTEVYRPVFVGIVLSPVVSSPHNR